MKGSFSCIINEIIVLIAANLSIGRIFVLWYKLSYAFQVDLFD